LGWEIQKSVPRQPFAPISPYIFYINILVVRCQEKNILGLLVTYGGSWIFGVGNSKICCSPNVTLLAKLISPQFFISIGYIVRLKLASSGDFDFLAEGGPLPTSPHISRLPMARTSKASRLFVYSMGTNQRHMKD
jgi:hypothetical protein